MPPMPPIPVLMEPSMAAPSRHGSPDRARSGRRLDPLDGLEQVLPLRHQHRGTVLGGAVLLDHDLDLVGIVVDPGVGEGAGELGDLGLRLGQVLLDSGQTRAQLLGLAVPAVAPLRLQALVLRSGVDRRHRGEDGTRGCGCGLRSTAAVDVDARLVCVVLEIAEVGRGRAPGDLDDGVGNGTDEMAVVGDQHDRARILHHGVLQDVTAGDVQVVGRLVDAQQVGRVGEHLGQREPALLPSREDGDALLRRLTGEQERPQHGAGIDLGGVHRGGERLQHRVVGVERVEGVLGVVGHGHVVTVSYYAQHALDALDPDNTVLQELAAAVDTSKVNPRTMLGSFLFSGEAAEKRIAVLSGGEKSRLALAKMLANPANLLCIDEPTNHLDIASRDVLEDAMVEYPGTIVLITHDRHLIRSVADTIIEVSGGTATTYLGDFEYYADKAGIDVDRRGAAEAASAPARAVLSPVPPVDAGSKDKRLEAERRNRRYRQTKELRTRLARVEKDLAEAEAEVAELTRTLADPGVYDDADKVKVVVEQHGTAKDRAAVLMAEWEHLFEAVERVESSA